MPTETFLKLSDEKKRKIIEAGKEEFSKVNVAEASIKNIAEKAGIARGSFYQYFESKRDLLFYILSENRDTIGESIDNIIENSNGDIFTTYLGLYDDMIEKCFNNMNQDIYRKIFENIKTNDETIYEDMEEEKKKDFNKIKRLISRNNLKVKEDEDLDLIIQILNAVTISSVVRSIKSQKKENAREEFIRKIEFIKKGILK